MGKTSIEWTEFSINPIRARNKATGKVGHFCEKISPGCGHCYASEWNENRLGTGLPFLPAWRDSVELFLDEGKLQEVLRRQKPTTYFWCDMTDLFLEHHPDGWIDACFATMALTPWHTHQVLTKRTQRMHDYFDKRVTRHVLAAAASQLSGRRDGALGTCDHAVCNIDWPIPNVQLGVSVEDQPRADERIHWLIRTPAALRFLSCEPLLGAVVLPVMIDEALDCPPEERRHWRFGGIVPVECLPLPPGSRGIDWVIVGGESGPDARPCHVRWIRSIVKQCRAAAVPVFSKQLGSSVWSRNDEVADWFDECGHLEMPGTPRFQGEVERVVGFRDRKGGDPAEWPKDLRVREFPGSVAPVEARP
jgi:protein gp37